MGERDYYDVLGVARGAGLDEVKKAYKRKARELHPDQNRDDPGAEARLKAVNEAYDVLKDPQKKEMYDRFGHAAFESGGGPSGFSGSGDFNSAFADVFENMFGDFMGSGRNRDRRRSTRGADLRYDLRISLADAYSGVSKQISVPRSISCESCDGSGSEGGSEPSRCPTCSGAGKVRAQQGFFTIERTCPTCNGLGQVISNPCRSCSGEGRTSAERKINVDIPAGIESGQRIRLSGYGDVGVQGGPPGDLYVLVQVTPHNAFERDGADLVCRVPVAMSTAALGGEAEVPTIGGGRVKIRIPAGCQTGKRMRLAGKGMPILQRRGNGDMHVVISVRTPTELTQRQRELLREFDEIEASNNSHEKDFFSKVKGFWNDGN